MGGRCECTTRTAGVPGHDPSRMLDPQYERRPRDLKDHEAALQKSELALTVKAAQLATAPFGMVPVRTALSMLPIVHVYGQVAFDSLHVLHGRRGDHATPHHIRELAAVRARQCRSRSRQPAVARFWDTTTELNTFNTPKGHAVAHLIDFMVVFGAVDLARLNNAEHDHVRHVKNAARRTRQHERTMMQELHHVVDRMGAVDVLHGQERTPS